MSCVELCVHNMTFETFVPAHGTQNRSCSGFEINSDGPLSSRPHAAPALKAMLGVDRGAACSCWASCEAVSRRRRMLCEHGSRKVDMVLNHMVDDLHAAPQQGSRLMSLADCRKTFSPAQGAWNASQTPFSTAPLVRSWTC